MSEDLHTVTDGNMLTHDEQTLRQLVHDLGERVKELNCLYGISSLVEKPGISLEAIIQGTVELLPAAWQYPEVACARITLEGQEFRSERFQETLWKQAADIVVHGERGGVVEVYYLEATPERDGASESGGPFLKEERNLLDATAERLGRVVERARVETALQRAHDELERRVEERTAELAQANTRLQDLHEIDRAILAAESPQTIARATVARVRQLVLCQRADVTLFDWAAKEVDILALEPDAGLDPGSSLRTAFELFAAEIETLRRDEVATVTGLALRGRIGELLFAEGVRSLVAVPLLSQDTLIGSLNLSLSASDPRLFVREWGDTVRQVADWLTIAIQQARLNQQIERHALELEGRVADRTRELTVLYEVAAFASRSLDLETTLMRALGRVLDAVGCEAGAVHVAEGGGCAWPRSVES
jgi:GAF domain-containing protein